MNGSGNRGRLRRAMMYTALTAFAAPVAAVAQPQTFQFDIPAQDLGTALRQFAQASGQQVVFDAALTRGRRSRPVSGTLTPEAALSRLLAGTGLAAARANGGIFMVREAAAPAAPPGTSDRIVGAAEELTAEQRITVTGTRIRGVRNVAAPTIEYSREQIEQTGYATVEELFDDLPQNLSEVSHDGTFATGTSRLAGTNTQSAVGISLRGLGPESTLVLLNGTRRPGNVFGRVVDISAIPLAIVERVEIVSGGRSAVYGSDAVAGVVNLVTRRSFEGAESQASFGWARHGAERLQLSQIVGFRSDNAGVVAAYDFLRSWPLDHRDTGLRQPSPVGVVPGRFELQPASRRHAIFVAGSIDAAPGIELRAHALYTNDRNESFASYGIPGIFELSQTTIVASQQYSGALGARFTLGRGWALDFSGTHGEVRNDERYISGGTTGGGRVKAGLSQVAAVADGPVFSTGADVARVALGAEYRRESLEQISRATGLATTDLDRDVGSLFAEMFVPFVLNAAGDHRLELSLAGRYDDYSRFGGTFNPQGGLAWQPMEGLRLRGTYSQAFRAPSLSDLSIRNQAILLPTPDPQAPGGVTTVLFWFGGNPDLRPESADTWTAGIDWVPSFAPRVRVSASYFDINYRRRIEEPAPDVGRALIDSIFFPGLINRTPTPAEVQAILASAPGTFFQNFTGVPFDPATQDLLAVFPGLVLFDNRRNNIGVDTVNGIDLAISSSFPLGPGELSLGLNGTYYIDFDRRTTATSPAFSQLNQPGRPVDLRFRANAGWTSGPWGVFTYVNHTDGYRDTFTTPAGRIESWTTVDIAFRFDGSRVHQAGFLRGLSVTASIDNLFDTPPPVFLSNILGLGYDPANASAVGRFFSLRVTKRW